MSIDQHATEMVEVAHVRQLAMRLEVSAIEQAIEAGHTTLVGQQAYALAWLAEYAAARLMRKDAAGSDDA